MELEKKIEEYLNQFERKNRGEKVITVFKEDASQELKDSVRQAHGDNLPDDWIFETYKSILCDLSGYTIENENDLDNYRFEIVDGLVDVYTVDLTAWLHSNNNNVYYLEDVQKEQGLIEDGFQLLAAAQYMAIDEIYGEVVSLLINS